MTAIKSEAGPAMFDDTRTYRYTLTRVWDREKGMVAFIGLNPSTADETKLDPTLRRCLRFANDWGYGAFVMLNLFAYRATDPLAMKAASHPVGPDNDYWLKIFTASAVTDCVIACWGVHGDWNRRAEIVRVLMREWGVKLHHLGLTKGGHPRHPLYLPSSAIPLEWA